MTQLRAEIEQRAVLLCLAELRQIRREFDSRRRARRTPKPENAARRQAQTKDRPASLRDLERLARL